ncbi:ATP-binding cassette domain-containing protein [Sphaerimonospora mesophila]|uniref:ATP-binding cassette domain-containing protein n=1 Tax=Sphaerimonospora mesophila TaxID=37483 RepID=UPI0006E2363A
MTAIVELRHLSKSFGTTVALDGLSLAIPEGSVVGLLGPNGAGKTTLINCLTTLLRPDSGSATIAGHDLLTEPDKVRAHIAVTGQFAAIDETLTGRENLVFFGRLLRLGKDEAKDRAGGLLERFGLSAEADKPVKTYSGGMRRKLDLAASLVVPRPVLFLDEPTTGLDPVSRETLWDTVRDLRSTGVTILLTTQYLEEADQLADRIVVIDHGKVVAEGTAQELKDRVGGGAVCEIRIADPGVREKAMAVLGRSAEGEDGPIVLPAEGVEALAGIVKTLEAAKIEPDDLALRKPTLDDVFRSLTGRPE